MTGRILIVDDESSMCEMLAEQLVKRGFEVEWRLSGQEALDLVAERDFNVVVSDLNMKGINGLELCERVVSSRPDIPVIVITAFGSMDSAIAAVRLGAYDYITKPFDIEEIHLSIDRAVQHQALKEEVRRLREFVTGPRRIENMVGTSEPIRKVFGLVSRVSETDTSILITGESGTGKELVARAIHSRSRRSSGPFVAINCAAVPEGLLESELFGHVRGAFTDAKATRTGLMVKADGGTILFDEIGDMPMSIQPKILRALQERCVRPVGGDSELPFDARIISATNRDLEGAVEERRFREDLYFRINVLNIQLPPLRARGGDVLLLAQEFLQEFAVQLDKPVDGISPAAAEKMLAYEWPGNVRELRNCMERSVALARYDQITVEDLPEKVRQYRSEHVIVAGDDPAELVTMEELERRYILKVLKASGGNKTAAARILGLDRRTLYRKLERYGVD